MLQISLGAGFVDEAPMLELVILIGCLENHEENAVFESMDPSDLVVALIHLTSHGSTVDRTRWRGKKNAIRTAIIAGLDGCFDVVVISEHV